MSGDMYGAYPDNFYRNHSEWPNPPQFYSDPRTWNYPNSASHEVEFNSGHEHRDECGGGFALQSVNAGWSRGRGSWIGRGSGNYTRGLQGNRHMRQRGHGNKRFNDTGRNEPSSGNYFCDSCERGFPTAEDLQSHSQNDHVICGLDGCTLSAHPKIMEKHQKMQHFTGLYSRIVSVFSQNPEEVKKWIADRKKNYPTKENIERRKQEEEECMERGESLGLRHRGGSRFGRRRGMNRSRGRGRGGLGRGNQQELCKAWTGGRNEIHKKKWNRKTNRNSRQKRDQEINKAPSEEKMEDEDNLMDIPMFPGTASILGIALEKCQSSDEEMEDTGAFSDTEWVEEKEVIADTAVGETISESADKEEVAAKDIGITITNALGLLMGTYASDDSDEECAPVEIKTPLDRRRAQGNENNSQEEKVVCDPRPAIDKSPSCKGNNGPSEDPRVDKEKKDEGDSDCSAPEEISIVKRAKVEEGKEENGEKEEKEEKGGKEEGSNSGKDGGIKKIRRCKKRGGSKGNAETGKEVHTNKKSLSGNLKGNSEVGRMVQKTSFPTLLEELLKNEIRHERNIILQCIRYIVQNNFFDSSNVVVAEVHPKTNENIEEPVIIEAQKPSSKIDECVNNGHENSNPEICNNLMLTLENST